MREGYRAEGLAQRLDGLKIAQGFYQANAAASTLTPTPYPLPLPLPPNPTP